MSARRFVSEPIQPLGDAPAAPSNNEPALPAAFRWHNETIEVRSVRKTWRSTKNDRGDTYLKRHWFEFELPDGRIAVVYFDRTAKRGSAPWSLFSLEVPTSIPER